MSSEWFYIKQWQYNRYLMELQDSDEKEKISEDAPENEEKRVPAPPPKS